MNLKVNQRIPLKIKRMGINGEGIGFYQKTLVFVPGVLKGEEIYCQITSIKRNFVEAKLLKINKQSKPVSHHLVLFMKPVAVAKSCTSAMTSNWILKDLAKKSTKKFKPSPQQSHHPSNHWNGSAQPLPC